MTWFVLCHLPAVVLLLAGQPLWSFGALFVGHMILLFGTLVPRSRLFGPIVTRFETSEPEIWLTFDDGPDPETTLPLLEVLRSHRVQATFFLIGDRAREFPHLVRSILADGHRIANHTQTHPAYRFWCLSPGAIRREVEQCQEVLTSFGSSPDLFRPPVGMKNPFVHRILDDFGLALVNWSTRGLDGKSTPPPAGAVVERILAGLHPGAIVVLHEGKETTIDATSLLLRELEQRQLRCTLPETVTGLR